MRSIRGLGIAALALLAACADRGPLEPDPSAAPPANAQRFECIAKVREQTVACAAHAPVSSGLRGAILGGQGQYVKLTSSNVAFNAGTGTFSFDETVQNLLPYAIGTLDGVNPDPAGIRVFFNSGPAVTSGWGTATVQNADGVGVFTATNQPYFQYPGILAPNATSAAKSWQLHVDPDVAFFAFTLFVSAHTAPTLVISEIMAHPGTASEPAGEWFEVHNRSSDAIDLQGWTIVSGGDTPHTIASSVVVSAHGYAVLGGSADPAANGGANVRYVYTGIDLANGTSDYLALHAPAGFTADSVDWGAAPAEAALPPPTGSSLELDSLDHDNTWLSGASSNWAPSIATFGTGQHGTPDARAAVALHAVSVAPAGTYTCAVDTSGQAWCWGQNQFGELGIGDSTGFDLPPFPTPRKVLQPAGVSFTQVAAELGLVCALATTGQPYCWGARVPLPTGSAQRNTPFPLPVPSGVTFASLGVGQTNDFQEYRVCGVDTTGQLWCWRANQPTATPVATPAPVVQLALAERETCVRSGAGNVYCNGAQSGADTFVVVQQPGVTFQWVDTNDSRDCGVSSIGQIQCWQPGFYNNVTPITSLPATVRFTSVSVGSPSNATYEMCGVATTGQVYCDGNNESGQTGDGTRLPHSLAPVAQPAGVLFSTVEMAKGQPHYTCALQTGSGNVYCWGENAQGQLGDGTTTDRLVPVPVYR
ncbi:Regulator of chromosome condensation (RCC1) repeat-containing protein [bacterium JGI 053]|nr:Regulator of chromosome condensation (RCC1) repeat-containing protein [bacterium JGI 053]